jgi:predicted ABC-class ATPase
MEALEAGAGLFLIDEDTSATNFMIRDTRMQHLVPKAFEPITPFVDRVRELHEQFGVSTVLVLGGSGDYIDAADTVVMLREYQALDVTARAREVAEEHRLGRCREVPGAMSLPPGRIPKRSSFSYGPRDKIRATGLKSLQVGRTDVDLSLVEQLVDRSQTRALAEVFRLLGRVGSQEMVALPELVDRIMEKVQAQGLEWLSPFQGQHPGDLALPRKQEVCAALNRWRRLVLEDAE